MRVRYIAVVLVIGAYSSWAAGSLVAAYITTFGCLILYALRSLEGNLVQCKDELERLNSHPGLNVRPGVAQDPKSEYYRKDKTGWSTFDHVMAQKPDSATTASPAT
jgi:hypothetical protein